MVAPCVQTMLSIITGIAYLFLIVTFLVRHQFEEMETDTQQGDFAKLISANPNSNTQIKNSILYP